MGKKLLWLLIGIIILTAVGLLTVKRGNDEPTKSATPSATPSVSPVVSATPSNIFARFTAPIDKWQERVIKKPFGIKISPNNSPVSPERFSGYHTGVDFETFSDEQDGEVPIYAICDGSLILKKSASGYGGVAVQSCKFESQDITVIYGHLNLASILAVQNQQLAAGEKIGILGNGFSAQTDGERKHLHLGIHKGKAINILGYVQNISELENWLDVTKYLVGL